MQTSNKTTSFFSNLTKLLRIPFFSSTEKVQPAKTFLLVEGLKHTAPLEAMGISKETIFSSEFQGKILSINSLQTDTDEEQEKLVFSFPLQWELGGKTVGIEQHKRMGYSFQKQNQDSSLQETTSVWISNPPEVVEHVFVHNSPMEALAHFEIYKQPNSLYFSIGEKITENKVNMVTAIVKQTNCSPGLKMHLRYRPSTAADFFFLLPIIEEKLGAATCQEKPTETLLKGKLNYKEGKEMLENLETFLKNDEFLQGGKETITITIDNKDNYIIKIPRESSEKPSLAKSLFNQAFLANADLQNKVVLSKEID